MLDSDDMQVDSMDPQCGQSSLNNSKKRKSSQDGMHGFWVYFVVSALNFLTQKSIKQTGFR
jgi:hypothetical protein